MPRIEPISIHPRQIPPHFEEKRKINPVFPRPFDPPPRVGAFPIPEEPVLIKNLKIAREQRQQREEQKAEKSTLQFQAGGTYQLQHLRSTSRSISLSLNPGRSQNRPESAGRSAYEQTGNTLGKNIDLHA